MTTKSPKKLPPSGYRLRICLCWKLFEVEGEGALPAAGALVLGLIVFAWVVFR
jgi:hypothetical protein